MLNRLLQGDVVEGFAVAPNGTPNMTVLVQPGSGRITTGTYPSSYGYLVSHDTSAGESVTIATASANNRIDYVVAWVDKGVPGSTSPTYVNNTNNVLKFTSVAGTPASSPVAPTASQISTAIGSANPYIILAQVAVNTSVTQITAANITDLRKIISRTGDNWWNEVGRATLSSDLSGALSLTVNIPSNLSRKYYHVKAVFDRQATPTGDVFAQLVINGDTAANYKNVGFVVDNNTTVVGQFALITNIGEVRTYEYGVHSIEADVSKPNAGDYATFTTKCGGPAYAKSTSGWWQNSSAITSFTLQSPSGYAWRAGTELIVLGHN